MSVPYQPEGYHNLTPYYHLMPGAARPLMEFLQTVFGAQKLWEHVHAEDGRVVRAEVRIGDSRLHLSELWGEFAEVVPGTHHVLVYVEDADAVYRRALEAGAICIKEPSDMSWGDRLACVEDPSGIRWHLQTQRRIVAGSVAHYW
jgi:PhnB protein